VIDGSTDLAPEDREVLSGVAQRRHLVVINKADLPKRSGANAINGQAKIIEVSALAGEGLDELSAAILDAFSVFDSESAGVLITNSRHYDLLLRAQSSLESAVALIQKDASEELVLVGLYNGLKFLGEITGETTSEDILTEIFSTFCIGK
jgi:tRNA modification GTPase